MKLVLLDTDTLGYDLDFKVFERYGKVECYAYSSPEEVVERSKDATICISNKVQYTKEIIDELPKLKLICLTSTGTNTADLGYCHEKGINVCNVVNYSTESVVQLTFSMIFYLLAPLKFYDDYTKNGSYVNDVNFSHYTHTWSELSNKTIGIVGLGTIGKRVADVARAFGAKVIYYSTSGKNKNDDYDQVDFESLLSRSDIISIHAPLTKESNNLFNINVMKKMKKSSILVNMGRGPIVNEEDLIVALNEGYISRAGLDVLAKEPMTENHPLSKLHDKDKLYITPHVGWASVEARNRMIDEVLRNISSFVEGDRRNVVN